MKTKLKDRLEYLRGELRAERISYEELAELQSLASVIPKDDVELLEAAGVPEFPATATMTLDEAFAKATEGPLYVQDEGSQAIIASRYDNSRPGVCRIYAHDCETSKANAALLAHCFNHMRELRDALNTATAALAQIAETAKGRRQTIRMKNDSGVSLRSFASLAQSEACRALEKANIVTLP